MSLLAQVRADLAALDDRPAAELTFEEKVARAKAAHAAEVAVISSDHERAVAADRENAATAAAACLPAAPPVVRRHLSRAEKAEQAEAIKISWAAFLAAGEVAEALGTYAALRVACHLPEAVQGQPAFDAVVQATIECGEVPHREKSLVRALSENWSLRASSASEAAPSRVVISGAGPVGLRAAVEASLMGMRVTVLEKREVFSRVNILTLWQPTADDLTALGAHLFYPRFSNRRVGTSPLHLGTREIQLVLLKNALLLGVNFRYSTELVALQAPSTAPSSGSGSGSGSGGSSSSSSRGSGGGSSFSSRGGGGGGGGGGSTGAWTAWARPAASTATHQTSGGALAFKPNKTADYGAGIGQGKCNLLATSELDVSFALGAEVARPEGVEAVAFDSLLLAEGEWSTTCKRLGVAKSIDRFTQAIGLVLNLLIDPAEPRTREPCQCGRSFNISPLDSVGMALKAARVDFEFGEFLRGETHYIVLSVKKATLLSRGVLRDDRPGAALLTDENLDEPKLMSFARDVASIVGLPDTTRFAGFHPAKLFDYSTRARCLCAFRVLAVREGGASAGEVLAMDLEAQPYLRTEETKYHARARAEADAEVAARAEERVELERVVGELKSVVRAGVQTQLSPPKPTLTGMFSLSAMAAEMEAAQVVQGAVESQVGELGVTCEGSAKRTFTLSAVSAQAGCTQQVLAARHDASDWTPEERLQMAIAQLSACERSLDELAEKARIQANAAEACRAKQAEWAHKTARAHGGYAHAVPIFAVGDSLLEPFWPQGLGSNRGFHSALDAVWAVHVLREEGLSAALLERNFWYDLMLQGPWHPPLLKPAAGWWADPISRYAATAIVRHKSTYTDIASKRLYRGAGATPPRIENLGLQAERGAGAGSVGRLLG